MDLNAPLGNDPPPPRRQRRLFLAAALAVAAAPIGWIGYIMATADPHGGEPFAVTDLPRPRPPSATRGDPTDRTPTGTIAVSPPAETPAGAPSTPPVQAMHFDEGTVENGVRVFRGSNGPVPPPQAPTRPLVIDVTRQIEAGPHKNAAGSSSAPAFRTAPSALATGSTTPLTKAAPRIAIYVGGMGLSDVATRTATEIMPAAVSFAFVPYGATVAAAADAARAKGHEILLQLPMQSAQGGAPGPHALRADEGPEAVTSDVEWLTSRFGGYDGVTNLLGAPVTASPAVMNPVLKALSARNLFYVDDGTSKRSIAATAAAQNNVAFANVDVVLDATADPQVVRANLDSLIAMARRKGQAIGMASGLPDHLAAIARFASELPTKGIVLVPVSALVRREANVVAATTR